MRTLKGKSRWISCTAFRPAISTALLGWGYLIGAGGSLQEGISAPQGGVYYVSMTGNDSDPGTESKPWRTIGKAAATLVAGDTVFIKAGTYQEQVVPVNSGTAGRYIVYAAYPGDTVVVDGTGVTVPEWDGLFNIVSRSYIKVSGLRVVNAKSNPHNPGILADSSSHVIIENNHVNNTNDSGIGIWSCNDVTVDHNEVVRSCQAGWNECISVGDTDGFVVKYNLVHESGKEGICLKDGSRNGQAFGNEVYGTTRVGFYVDAQARHTTNIEVFSNVAHGTVQGGFALASEVGGLLEKVRVYNNVAYGNGWTGIAVTSCCIAAHPMSDIRIVNNTLYNNGVPPWGGGIYVENSQAQGVIIRNNIASRNLTFQIVVNRDVPKGYYSVDHNLIDGFRGDSDELRGADYVEGDPRFKSAAGADFHLLQDSPAIDKGSSVGAPSGDFEGFGRGTTPDIGAYEHRESSQPFLIPQVAVGGGSTGGGMYVTVFTLLNTGSEQLQGSLILTRQDGTPLTAALSSGLTSTIGSSIPISLRPGQTTLITAAAANPGDATLYQGWGRVESTGGKLSGAATFQFASSGVLKSIAGVLLSSPTSAATIPVDDDVDGGRYTGYAVANPGSSSIAISVREVSADGNAVTALADVVLAPGQQKAAFFFQDPKAGRKFKGSAVLFCGNEATFAVVALVDNQNHLTAIPVIPAKSPAVP